MCRVSQPDKHGSHEGGTIAQENRVEVVMSLTDYRALEVRLYECRCHRPAGSDAEDPILDEMDGVWWDLTDEERALLDSEPSHCWPKAKIVSVGTVVDGRAHGWVFDHAECPAVPGCLVTESGTEVGGYTIDELREIAAARNA
jgi:hypothetical protein